MSSPWSHLSTRRSYCVTSSNVAGATGQSPYDTPDDAARKILGLDKFEGNQGTRLGQALERPFMRYMADEFLDGAEWWQPGRLDGADERGFRVHPDGWAGTSMDFLARIDGELVGVEVKTSKQGSRVNEPKTGPTHWWGTTLDEDMNSAPGGTQVPSYVRIQCLWHLFVYPEVNRIAVPALLAMRPGLYWVERDDDEIGKLSYLAHEFWKEKIEPELIAA